jgi:predicted small secreted protein
MKQILILLVLAVLVAGCNTISGLGKDIEAAGEGIQRSSGKK